MSSFFIPEDVVEGASFKEGNPYEFSDATKLGQGGLGSVYLVDAGPVFDAVGAVCCVKMLNKSFLVKDATTVTEEDDRRRLRLQKAAREEYGEYVRAKGAKGHAPRVYALGQVLQGSLLANSATYAMVMEYLPGMSLGSAQPFLAGRQPQGSNMAQLSAAQTARVGALLCEALHDLHVHNVVHRDIQPSNVMVTLNEDMDEVTELRLVDLGQSTTPETDVTAYEDASRLATVAYGAPEMFAKHADKGLYARRNEQTVDLWGIGCILYWLRTGERPPLAGYANGDGYKALVKAKERPLALPASCTEPGDRELGRLIGICTQYDPDDRIYHDLALAKRLRQVAAQSAEPADASGASAADPKALFESALAARKRGDDAEAARLYQQAADLGHAPSIGNLGYLYERGLGVEKSLSRAIQLYTRAAEMGNAQAQSNLAVCYREGRGVEKDAKQALAWSLKAAEQGVAADQVNVGYAYSMGEGLEQDCAKAAEWYRRAADQGNIYAQNNLGWYYANGWGGLPKDFAKARELMEKALAGGNKHAQANLDRLAELEQAELEKAEREQAEKGQQAAGAYVEPKPQAAAQPQPQAQAASPAKPQAGAQVKPRSHRVYPNDPCPCGSGKKYKNCHGKLEVEQAAKEERAKKAKSLYLQALNYEGGYGVYRDHEKALELMLEAFELGSAEAATWLHVAQAQE